VSRSLAELQRSLAQHILGAGDEPGLERLAVVPAGANLGARLAVYTDGYPARMQESLRETYPAIAKILGDGSFDGLADRYVEWAPAGWCNLNNVGVRLPDFLGEDPLTTDLPFLPDLARLEWAVIECFNAALQEPFDIASCGDWGLDDWAEARIGFQPGTAIVGSEWPIRRLREARHLERHEIDVDLVDRPESVLIHRDGFDVSTRTVDPSEALSLVRLGEGATLGEVMAELADAGASADAVVALFAGWAQLGLVISCGPAHSQ